MLSESFLDLSPLAWYCVWLQGDDKMKNIIEELWNGEINPQDTLVDNNPHYKELQHLQARNKTELLESLSEDQKEKLESLIAEFRLEKVRKNLGDRLSGGERRRTEIARCLAIDPKFIMLDEPFAGVDPIAVEDIQYIVYKLKEKNIGILITDHNAPETLSITDRAYLLFEGKILFQGTSEELASNPVVREKYLGRNFIFHRKQFDHLEGK